MAVKLFLFGLAAVVLAALAGCTQSLIMQHPDGRTAECGHYSTHSAASTFRAADRERQCVEDFRKQGFERQP